MRRPSVRAIVGAFILALLAGPASALAAPVAAPANAPLATWQAQGRVSALAIANGVVYLGGSFTSLTSHGSPRKTVTRNHLAAINEATGVPTAWNPNVNGAVHSIKVIGKRVYVGGSFTSDRRQGGAQSGGRRPRRRPRRRGLPRVRQRRGRRAGRLGDEALRRRHVLAGRRPGARQPGRRRPRQRRHRRRLGGPHQRRRAHAARRHRLGPGLRRRPLLGGRRRVARPFLAAVGAKRGSVFAWASAPLGQVWSLALSPAGAAVRRRRRPPGRAARLLPAVDREPALAPVRRRRRADGQRRRLDDPRRRPLPERLLDEHGRRQPVGVHGAAAAGPLLRHRRRAAPSSRGIPAATASTASGRCAATRRHIVAGGDFTIVDGSHQARYAEFLR